jgi:hypothetical protein
MNARALVSFACAGLVSLLAACGASGPTATNMPAAVATANPAAVAGSGSGTNPTPTPASAATPTTSPTAIPTVVAIATPTPMPAVTPTPSPITGPASIALANNTTSPGCANENASAFTVAESGYTGAFTATSANTSLVTVAQTGPAAFTATEAQPPPAFGTSTSIVVADANGNKLTIPVSFNVVCL